MLSEQQAPNMVATGMSNSDIFHAIVTPKVKSPIMSEKLSPLRLL